MANVHEIWRSFFLDDIFENVKDEDFVGLDVRINGDSQGTVVKAKSTRNELYIAIHIPRATAPPVLPPDLELNWSVIRFDKSGMLEPIDREVWKTLKESDPPLAYFNFN